MVHVETTTNREQSSELELSRCEGGRQSQGIDDRMIANNLEPHYLTHPGEVIKDELEARGISQRQLAKSIGVPASQLNELLNTKRSLSAEMALLIGQALDLDPVNDKSLKKF